ncbi:MAG: DUF465 domain-containing protein [Hyphomonadaceae bacterium]|nr:DUF465 domain-containing protein [Hyphomonadaceae bacterium]
MANQEHLDHALEEEFAGHGETIHKLKVSNPQFKVLMEENHALWLQIRAMQSNVTPADDAVIERLEKERLQRLDQIAAMIRQAEA